MLIDKTTHIVFENRKEAKELLGENRYNFLIKVRRLIFIEKNSPFQTPEEQIEWVIRNYPNEQNYEKERQYYN